MNLNARLRLVALTSLAVPMAPFFASYYALRTSTQAVETQYRDEMVPATMLAHIDSLIKNTRSHVLGGYMHNPANELSKLHDHPLDLHVNFLMKAHGDIEQKWAAYTALPLRDDEAELVRVAGYGIKLYLNQTLAPAEEALRTGRYDDVIRATTSSFKAIGATAVSNPKCNAFPESARSDSLQAAPRRRCTPRGSGLRALRRGRTSLGYRLLN